MCGVNHRSLVGRLSFLTLRAVECAPLLRVSVWRRVRGDAREGPFARASLCDARGARGLRAVGALSEGTRPRSLLFCPPPPSAASSRCARARRSPLWRQGRRRAREGRPAAHMAPTRSRPCGGAARVAGGTRSPERPPLASRVSRAFSLLVLPSVALRHSARAAPNAGGGGRRGAHSVRGTAHGMWRTRDPGRAGSPRLGRSPKHRAPSSRVFFCFLFYFLALRAPRAMGARTPPTHRRAARAGARTAMRARGFRGARAMFPAARARPCAARQLP